MLTLLLLSFVISGLDLATCSWICHQRKMNEVLACGIFILVLDATLCLALWLGLVLLQCSSCGGLLALWAFGTVKWAILHTFTKTFTHGKPQAVLCRLVALLCLLSPVFESGRVFVASPSEPDRVASPDLSTLLLGWMSSLLTCVVWEIGLCADGKMKNSELSARRLLLRMLKYFKPDRLYIISAFSFLILAVFCKCETLSKYFISCTCM